MDRPRTRVANNIQRKLCSSKGLCRFLNEPSGYEIELLVPLRHPEAKRPIKQPVETRKDKPTSLAFSTNSHEYSLIWGRPNAGPYQTIYDI